MMNCPKCKGVLTSQNTEKSIYKCSRCCGLWFPDGISAVHEAKALASDIDNNVTSACASFDAINEIHCPACHTLMTIDKGARQAHILFEVCPQCHSVFLDTGELKDFADFSPLERLKYSMKWINGKL
jgi:Zn-finger nucleic acid-binding protein